VYYPLKTGVDGLMRLVLGRNMLFGVSGLIVMDGWWFLVQYLWGGELLG